MAALPRRRDRAIPHLDAHIEPLERALGACADAREAQVEEMGDDADPIERAVALAIAKAFRDLAEEAHYW